MTLAAAGVIRRGNLPNSCIHWLLVKRWMCTIGGCTPHCTAACIRLVMEITIKVGVVLCIINFGVIYNQNQR